VGVPKWRALIDTISTVVVAVAALCMLGFYVHDRSAPTQAGSFEPLQTIDSWREEARFGRFLGDTNAPVVITAFMDFQCPFCRRLSFVLDTLLTEQAGNVAVVLQHYPLSSHPFADAAAVAAECAHRQGKFKEMSRALFTNQDSLGVKAWNSYAVEANLPDSASFSRCIALPVDSFPSIRGGRLLGDRTGVTGTPTIWVNENRIGRTDLVALREWVLHLSAAR
jgi:protein-disulfide isomerase